MMRLSSRFSLLGLAVGLVLGLGASTATAQPDQTGSVVINEDTGFPGVCNAPCFSLQKDFELYLDGNPSGPGVCAAGDNTYLYTLTHLGGSSAFVPAITKFEIAVANAAVNATGAGFIAGGVDPSATTINTTLDVVEWDFLAPPLANGQVSSQLFVCSPLLPGSVSDNTVSVDGQASLDAPGTCTGPFEEPAAVCEVKVEKFCEVLDGGGGPHDKDKDKDMDGFPDPPDNGDQVCQGRVRSLVLEYTGLGCAASSNRQGDDPEMTTGRKGKALCRGATRLDTDGASGQNNVRVVVKNSRQNQTYLDQSGINVGDEIVIEANQCGRTSLHGSLKIKIFDSAGSRIEMDRFKSNCRKAEHLAPGDQFGSLKVNEIVLKNGTTITVASQTPTPPDPATECSIGLPRVGIPGDKDKDKDLDPNPGEDVKYTYRIMNIGTSDATNVTVVDDVLGVVPGSPIASIAPGGTVELMATQSISVDTVNTVTVTGNPGGAECSAAASATVLVEQAGDVPDKDKDKDKDKDHD
jgi:hypothetical protein